MKLIALSLATLGSTVYSGRPVRGTDDPKPSPPAFTVKPGTYTVAYAPQGNGKGHTLKEGQRTKETLTIGCDLRFNKAVDGKKGEFYGRINNTVSATTCTPCTHSEFKTDVQWSAATGLKFFVDNVEGKGSRECLVPTADGLDGVHYGVDKKYWGRVQFKLDKPNNDCKGQPTPGTYKVEYADAVGGYGESTFKKREKGMKIGCDLLFTNLEGKTSSGFYDATDVATQCDAKNVGARPDREHAPDDYDATDPKNVAFFVNGLFGDKNRDCLWMDVHHDHDDDDHSKDKPIITGIHYAWNAKKEGELGFYSRVRFTLEEKLDCSK